MSWELGEPLTYKALGPDAVPLSAATYWPEDMSPSTARDFATRLESSGAEKIGAVRCDGAWESHASWWMPDSGCPWCRAVV